MGPDAVAAAGLPKDPDFGPQGLMSKPGIQGDACSGLDYRSTVSNSSACLKIVAAWVAGA